MALQYLFPVLYSTIIPSGFEIHIFTLALLNALMITHYNLLIGRERIRTYNWIFTIQIMTLLGTFMAGIFMFNDHSPKAYVNALYYAYGIGGILAFASVIKTSGKMFLKGWLKVLKQVIHFGFISFIGNILNVGNKRISFYVLRYFTGLSALGIYNAGVQLTEGLRIIGQSISLVQFSSISNTNDTEYAKILTIKLMKFTLSLTLLAVIVLLAIPESLYTWIFSKDFTEVKPIIVALSPGVVALAANNIFSHYFSGLGNPKVNMWANLVGLFFTLVLAFTLIPLLGYIGAAITASVSYISSVVYQYFIFRKETNTKLKEWIPTKKDSSDFITMSVAMFKKKV
jgi:O-antigen/teichoic acid export membrane protein